MEDDGGGKGNDYVMIGDNVVTPVNNDNVEKVRRVLIYLLTESKKRGSWLKCVTRYLRLGYCK